MTGKRCTTEDELIDTVLDYRMSTQLGFTTSYDITNPAKAEEVLNGITSKTNKPGLVDDGTGLPPPGPTQLGRNARCFNCDGCRAKNCGKCRYCQDMPRFGGPGHLKQVCIQRHCMRLASNHDRRNNAHRSLIVDHEEGDGGAGLTLDLPATDAQRPVCDYCSFSEVSYDHSDSQIVYE